MRAAEGGEPVGFNGSVPGAAGLHLVDGVALLRPEEQVFTAMLIGFANQQLARNLAGTTVEGRETTVKAFAAYVSTYPWQWTPAMVDEWLGDLRSLRDLKRSTIRSYSEAVRAFCHFVTDPIYEWTATCEQRFGTHPVQVVHEWNTAVHVQDNESDPKKRAFTKAPSCTLSLRTATTRLPGSGPSAARAGCPRSATPPCSRPRTPTACGATRRGCWTLLTSAAIRTAPSSASSAAARSGSARPRRAHHPSVEACSPCGIGPPTSWTSGSPRSGPCSAPTTTRRPGRRVVVGAEHGPDLGEPLVQDVGGPIPHLSLIHISEPTRL